MIKLGIIGAMDVEVATLKETMENLTSKLNSFLVKGAYASVSHIQHQNGFYQYGIERLNIKEDVQSVTVGVEALAQIQRLKHEALEESKEVWSLLYWYHTER